MEKSIKDLTERIEVLENNYKELRKENEELRALINAKKGLIPKVRQISDRQIQEIRDLREEGMSYTEIARKTGWSKTTIGKVLNGVYK